MMHVDPDYLKDSNGNWLPSAGDVAEMITMLELCGERFEYIPEPLYVYNRENMLSDGTIDSSLQLQCEKEAREKTPCSRLESL